MHWMKGFEWMCLLPGLRVLGAAKQSAEEGGPAAPWGTEMPGRCSQTPRASVSSPKQQRSPGSETQWRTSSLRICSRQTHAVMRVYLRQHLNHLQAGFISDFFLAVFTFCQIRVWSSVWFHFQPTGDCHSVFLTCEMNFRSPFCQTALTTRCVSGSPPCSEEVWELTLLL